MTALAKWGFRVEVCQRTLFYRCYEFHGYGPGRFSGCCYEVDDAEQATQTASRIIGRSQTCEQN
jgi:hypothetical protein